MSVHRRTFTREFKLHVLREIDAGKPLAQVAREHQVHPTVLHRWRRQLASNPEQAFPGQGKAHRDESRIAELERLLGQMSLENALLKKALLGLEASRSPSRPQPPGGKNSTGGCTGGCSSG